MALGTEADYGDGFTFEGFESGVFVGVNLCCHRIKKGGDGRKDSGKWEALVITDFRLWNADRQNLVGLCAEGM